MKSLLRPFACFSQVLGPGLGLEGPVLGPGLGLEGPVLGPGLGLEGPVLSNITAEGYRLLMPCCWQLPLINWRSPL